MKTNTPMFIQFPTEFTTKVMQPYDFQIDTEKQVLFTANSMKFKKGEVMSPVPGVAVFRIKFLDLEEDQKVPRFMLIQKHMVTFPKSYYAVFNIRYIPET